MYHNLIITIFDECYYFPTFTVTAHGHDTDKRAKSSRYTFFQTAVAYWLSVR